MLKQENLSENQEQNSKIKIGLNDEINKLLN